jgi:hypothetical protein
MPTDSILVVTLVCIMFLVFAAALAWADHSTSRWLRDRAAAKETATDKRPPYQKAA